MYVHSILYRSILLSFLTQQIVKRNSAKKRAPLSFLSSSSHHLPPNTRAKTHVACSITQNSIILHIKNTSAPLNIIMHIHISYLPFFILLLWQHHTTLFPFPFYFYINFFLSSFQLSRPYKSPHISHFTHNINKTANVPQHCAYLFSCVDKTHSLTTCKHQKHTQSNHVSLFACCSCVLFIITNFALLSLYFANSTSISLIIITLQNRLWL